MTDHPELTPPPQGPVAEPLVTAGESSRRRLMLVGVAVACVLGLGIGVLARPNLGDAGEKKSAKVAEAATTSNGGVQITVANRPPPPIVATGGKLETMSSPPLAETLPAQTERVAAREAAPQPQRRSWFERLFGVSGSERRAEAQPAPAPRPVRREPVQPQDEGGGEQFAQAPYAEDPYASEREVREPVRVRANPSFNCRYARSRSEMMICDDPDLAAADRRLARAYSNAIRAGYPQDELRREQDGWLRARERAAMADPDAVAEVYELRIQELEEASY